MRLELLCIKNRTQLAAVTIPSVLWRIGEGMHFEKLALAAIVPLFKSIKKQRADIVVPTARSLLK